MSEPNWPLFRPTYELMVAIKEQAEAYAANGDEASQSLLNSSRALMSSRADHILEHLGVDVYSEQGLFDYLMGFTAGVDIAHSVTHHFGVEMDCQSFMMAAATNCLPLLPMVPAHKVLA